MPQTTGLNQRLDPYKNFKLKLIVDNRTYSGSIRTGITSSSDIVNYRDGGDPSTPRKGPGRTKFDPVTLNRGVIQDPSLSNWANQVSGQGKYPSIPLNRGVTQDPSLSNWANQTSGQGKYPSIPLNRGVTQDSSFSSWASQVLNYGSSLGSEVSLANFRKNVLLEFYNEAGQLVVRYRLNGNQVSETQTKPLAVYQHFLHSGGPGTLQEQLAAIFENSLRRSTG
jgi:hypothetical protein